MSAFIFAQVRHVNCPTDPCYVGPARFTDLKNTVKECIASSFHQPALHPCQWEEQTTSIGGMRIGG